MRVREPGQPVGLKVSTAAQVDFHYGLTAAIESGCDVLRKRLSSGMADRINYSTLRQNTNRSGSKIWTSGKGCTTANRRNPMIDLR